jgi:nucleotide-binding universal stress UspA family protein/nitrite reductase/ring-hydroxylating ferredoxin subunit
MGYQTIVIGTDGSATAYRAQHKAVRFARRVGARVIIASAHGDGGLDPTTAAKSASRARESAEHYGVEARTVIRRGEAGETLAAIAREADADLIVVGDAGMGEARRFRLGGVAERAAHAASCDVLIVRTRRPARRKRTSDLYGGIVVGTDGSPTATEAVRKAFDLGMMMETRVNVVYVAGDPLVGAIVLERAIASKPDWVPVTSELVEGTPADKLEEIAGAQGCDLIVVGNKGVTGTRRFLLAAVPVKLAHHASQDVLIAKTVGRSYKDLQPGQGGVVNANGEKVAVYIDESGGVRAFSARCQHMGCTVDWNPAHKTWDCPCHGSRYHLDGQVLQGPTTRPLPPRNL